MVAVQDSDAGLVVKRAAEVGDPATFTDAILTMKDGIIKLATAEGDDTLAAADVTAPYFLAVREALDHWRRGAPPPIGAHDLVRAVRLIDKAYQWTAEVDRRANMQA